MKIREKRMMNNAFYNALTEDERKIYHWGIEDERQRVVKQLEDYISVYYDLSPNDESATYPIEAVIKLIKEG